MTPETPEEYAERIKLLLSDQFRGPERPICECADGDTCEDCDPQWSRDEQ